MEAIPVPSFCCCANRRLDSFIKSTLFIRKCFAHCRAARTIFSFLSLKLASLFSAVSSQTALPPISSSFISSVPSAMRRSRLNLDISVPFFSYCFSPECRYVAERCVFPSGILGTIVFARG